MAPSTPSPQQPALPFFSRAEVAKHAQTKDCWIVIDGEVYDVSKWLSRHPGGVRVLRHYAGEDATAAWTSFHNNKSYVSKFLQSFHIGHILPEEKELSEITQDFMKLRKELEDKGLFKANPWFFIAHFSHIVLLNIATILLLWYCGNTWATWLTATVLVTTAQAQAGWLQHDFGHHTVFNSTKLNHFVHDIVIGLMKGVSSFWWNYRHFQHHAKPNVYTKDPDITMPYLFLFGKIIPKKWGSKHRGKMPYNYQQSYFFLIGPPLLLPVYFHLEVVLYVLNKRLWKDLFWMLAFYFAFHVMFAPLVGGFWANFRFYFFIRFLESHWFTWATQMSHLPMHVDRDDKKKDWVTLQLLGTCNVDQSFFNDWWSGHLNFQIEHHLFPTMPRHNFQAAQPYAKELCRKHHLEYTQKSLWTAFGDIVRSLKESGEIYMEAWDAYDLKAE